MQTKISQWGNSKAIRIPASIVKQLNLKDSQAMTIEIKDQSLIFTPKDLRADTIEELFADYNTAISYTEVELNWGPAVGEELEW